MGRTEAIGDFDAGDAGGLCYSGLLYRIHPRLIPPHAPGLPRWRCSDNPRHCPELAFLQPSPSQVVGTFRGRTPPSAPAHLKSADREKEGWKTESQVEVIDAFLLFRWLMFIV